LDATLNELTLDGRFSLNVLRGKLRTIELDWPNWKADGWKLESFGPQGELVEALDPEVEDKPGRLRLRLVEEHVAQSTLQLKARREIKPGIAVPLSLPRLVALEGTSTQLTINEAENMTCDMAPIGETALELDLSHPVDKPSGSPAGLTGKSRSYRIRSTEQLFTLRTVLQERRLDVNSSTLLELAGSRLRCVQSLRFDVQHERLAQTRLAIPAAWRNGSLRFQIDGDRALTPQWSAGDSPGIAVATLLFPEPRLGQFTVQALFDLPLSDSLLAGGEGAEVPIFSCLDQAIHQAELQVAPSMESDLTVLDANWKPRADASGQPRWIAAGPVSSVKVQFETGPGATQPLLITAAEVRGEWDRQGTIRCIAKYRIAGLCGRIHLLLPAEAQLLETRWDGRSLSEPADITSESQPRQYTLRIRSAGFEPESHSLTVYYRLPPTQACGLWNQWSLGVPRISQARWLALGQWRIRLPRDQHLFSYSSAVTAQFRWQRNRIFWSRVSPSQETTDASGFPDDELDSRDESLGPANRYAFGQFGELRELRFSTMSGAMILFVGASISLLVGFLVLNLSWLRHGMTLWGGVFLTAFAGLWFRSQLEVLLQPILVGFLFPLIAVWLQSFRRRKVPPVMSFDPLMELAESRSSVARARLPSEAVGPEPVLVRSPSGSTHDFLRTEAGSVVR
ncbi:MAG TPA: hypothetical protein VM165_12085, partial [Planctomycetaceae bacterium]|nr:hypothetical protein [Planctomycetaceae bacterium]